jgi:hypothetical protein
LRTIFLLKLQQGDLCRKSFCRLVRTDKIFYGTKYRFLSRKMQKKRDKCLQIGLKSDFGMSMRLNDVLV